MPCLGEGTYSPISEAVACEQAQQNLFEQAMVTVCQKGMMLNNAEPSVLKHRLSFLFIVFLQNGVV
jgi:hypothetical protein